MQCAWVLIYVTTALTACASNTAKIATSTSTNYAMGYRTAGKKRNNGRQNGMLGLLQVIKNSHYRVIVSDIPVRCTSRI